MKANQIKANNLIDGLLQQAETDPEYKAWREAHPEPDPKLQGMTREEKINRLIDKLMKLADLEEQREYKALDKLLGYQCLSAELDYFYHTYIERKKAENYDTCLLIADIFNYGVICGKRAERARRRGELKQNTSL